MCAHGPRDTGKPESHTRGAPVVTRRHACAAPHTDPEGVSGRSRPSRDMEQGCTLPSGSHAHAINEGPLHHLFRATWLARLCLLCPLSPNVQWKTAPRHRGVVLARVAELEKATACPRETEELQPPRLTVPWAVRSTVIRQ